jgi:hypothetical protein
MAYGTVKVDNITFDDGGSDQNVTVSGLYNSLTSGITVTGTISGAVVIGSTSVSGTTVAGVTVTGTTVQGASGTFTSLTGTTIQGTTATYTTGSFTSLTGTTIQGTTATYTTGSFTSLTGTTTTGTTANFASGVFTTSVSGTTVIASTGTFTSLTGTTTQGTTATYTTGSFTSLTGTTTTGTTSSFTSGVFTTLSGATATFTSGIIASGTAAAPSLAILADLDTGLFSPGADQLAVATNGTARLYIASDGKVGVGTTSPGSTLDIYSSQYAGLGFGSARTTAADNIGGPVWKNSTNTEKAFIQCTVDGQLKFGAGGATERLRITAAGLVGVGVSSPSYLLDVAGTHRNSGIYFNSNDTPQGTAGTISRNSVVGLVSRGIAGSVFDWSVYSASGTALITNPTGSNNIGFSGGNVSFTGGSVGIGTSAPSELLTVVGNARLDKASSDLFIKIGGTTRGGNTYSNYIDLDNNGFGAPGAFQTASKGDKLILWGGNGPDSESRIGFSLDDAVWIKAMGATVPNAFAVHGAAANSGSPNRLFTITKAGLVGIGTSSPSSVLHCVGSKDVANFTIGAPLSTVGGGAFSNYSQVTFENTSGANANAAIRAYGNIWNSTGSALSLMTSSGGAPVDRLYINSAGSVGIGTTSPSGNLHVNGGSATIIADSDVYSTYEFYTSGVRKAFSQWENSANLINITALPASSQIVFKTGDTERGRWDGAGRLLVGTSSAFSAGGDAQYGRFHMVGNTASSAGHAILALGRGEAATTITTDEVLGYITFSDSTGNTFASIHSSADANAGAGDYPGRLVFSTTADGAASPTERVRITSTGQVRLAGAGITFNGDTATANELDDYEEGTCLATTGTWTDAGSTYTKIGRMVYVEIRGEVVTTPQAIALPFAFGDICIGGYVMDTITFNGITNGVNASTAGATITLPVGFIKGFLSYRAA